MEIKGKIIAVLPEQSGMSKAGNAWKKREYVLETIETYPKKVHFDFFGDRADQYPLAIGDVINLSFDIESREYNGRWYTSIRGWKAEKEGAAMNAGADPYAPPAGYGAPAAPGFNAPAVNPGPAAPGGAFGSGFSSDQSDDLPF